MWKFVYLGYHDDYYIHNIDSYCNSVDGIYRVNVLRKRLKGIKKLLLKLHLSFLLKKAKPGLLNNLLLEEVIDRDTKTQLGKYDKICFFVCALRMYDMGIEELPVYLRREYPNSKVVLDFDDKVEVFCSNPDVDLALAKKSFDLVISFSRTDVEKYGLYWRQPLIPDYSGVQSGKFDECDLFFVGGDKGRFDKIINIFEQCVALGLRCEFFLSGIAKERQRYNDKIHYIRYISYMEVLERVKNSKCVLNLIQDGAEGITLRDFEAIGMNKILVTNGTAIKSFDFYSEEMVISVDKMESVVGAIEKYSQGKSCWENYDKFLPENYFQTFGRYLEQLEVRK